MSLWRAKANRIIADLCREAYYRSNILPDGRRRKNYMPYSVPALAEQLVDALYHDDEATAKSLFQIYHWGIYDRRF